MKIFDFINAEIASRLANRFLLAESPTVQEPYFLMRSVQPVTIFDDLLEESKIAGTGPIDISAASSLKVIFTVPVGKRWKLQALYREGTTANTRLYLINEVGTGFTLTPSSTTEATIFPGTSLFLEEKWTIDCSTTGNPADNTRSFQIIYQESDAYRS